MEFKFRTASPSLQTVASEPTFSNYLVLDRKEGNVEKELWLVPVEANIFKSLERQADGTDLITGWYYREAGVPSSYLPKHLVPFLNSENAKDRYVPITGVAVMLLKEHPDTGEWLVDIGEENRVVLTKDEVAEIGSHQPYLLADGPLYRPDGTAWDDIEVGRIIHSTRFASRWKDQKENRGKKLDPSEIPQITDEESLAVVAKAREYADRFEMRHFKMAVWREGIKLARKGKSGDASLWDAVLRCLKEELYRIPKEGRLTDANWYYAVPKNYCVYKRPGGSSYVIGFKIDVDDTQIDMATIRKKGFCNWFSPKKCPLICENDLFETRNHRFVTQDEAWNILSKFQTTYSAMGCDFSKNGALDFYSAMIRPIEEDFFANKEQASGEEKIDIDLVDSSVLSSKQQPDLARFLKARFLKECERKAMESH